MLLVQRSLSRSAVAYLFVLGNAFCVFAARQAIAAEPVAVAARAMLKKHCVRCHGIEREVPGLDVLDRESLTRSRPDEQPFLVPGNLDESLIWQRAGVDRDMPPASIDDRPTEAELEALQKWIEAGAPVADEQLKDQVSELSVLEAILDDLQETDRSDRRHRRYISLHTVSNSPQFSAADVRIHHAAVVKLLNSTSRQATLVQPTAIEVSGTPQVIAVDLRDFGWNGSLWSQALQDYPYGLNWNDPRIQNVLDDIEQTVGRLEYDGVPYVRADWFVATASRPRVYHALLDIPSSADELEQELGVDRERAFRFDRLQRAGFAGSGVSHHNRAVDRYEASQTRYYYRSYDFGGSIGRKVLSRFPLGPKLVGNDFFDDFGFAEDGGEIIWSLPNGMQGYMLVDNEGQRIDEAPIAIVRDLRETAGTPAIVNGLSCIACHRNGLLEYSNSLRAEYTLAGEAREKAARLLATDEQIRRSLQADRRLYLDALEQLIGPILRVGDSTDKEITEFVEPVSVVTKWYSADVSLSAAAAELNLESSDELASAIRVSQDLQQLGLGPLAAGGDIPREMWDTRAESPASVFQRAAVALRIGTGLNPD